MSVVKDLLMLLKMLQMAVEQRDKQTAIRYINQIGSTLNKMVEEVNTWENKK